MHTGAKVGCPGSLGSKETCDWTSRSDWFREIRTRTFVFKGYLYKGVTQASDATWKESSWKESSISGSGHLQDSRLDTEPGEWVDTVPKHGALWGGRTKCCFIHSSPRPALLSARAFPSHSASHLLSSLEMITATLLHQENPSWVFVQQPQQLRWPKTESLLKWNTGKGQAGSRSSGLSNIKSPEVVA